MNPGIESAIIISLLNNGKSNTSTRVTLNSVRQYLNKKIDNLWVMPATTPDTMTTDLIKILNSDVWEEGWDTETVFTLSGHKGTIHYTWPKTYTEDGPCEITGLYKKAYLAADVNKVISCTISHMRAWKYSVETNQEVLVLEHDAFIHRAFNLNTIKEVHPNYGVISLTNPIGATRRAQTYFDQVVKAHSLAPEKMIYPVPDVNQPSDPNLPQGLAGNSSYMIQPWAAKALLKKTSEIGLWPNDALMCKELFPGMLHTVYPFCSKVQKTPSTTLN